MTQNIYVLYHGSCMDGTGAKYAAWKKFGDKAQYIAVYYGKSPPCIIDSGAEVYIVDFSYSKETLEQLRLIHKSVVVLDHHKTAEEALRGVPDCVFDMNKSGAVLAWEYFHPGVEVPAILLHIQDRDLWKFKLDGTKEVGAALHLLEGDMEQWDVYIKADQKGINGLLSSGTALIRSDNLKVKSAIKSKVKVLKFLGYKIGAINANELISEIGAGIYNSKNLQVDFAMMYCLTPENEVLFSLRSRPDFDVSEVAKKYGGGGHAQAAGFKGNLDMLVDILTEKLSDVQSM